MTVSSQELSERTHRLTEQVADNAEATLRATQASTNAALEQLSDDIAAAKEKVAPIIDRLSHRAEQFTRRGTEAVIDSTEKVRAHLDTLNDDARARIQHDPVKAVVIAAAAGAAVALLARWLTRPDPAHRRER